jgi:hypothetical protein
VSAETRSGEGRRRDTLTREEAVKRGRAAMGCGTLGHAQLGAERRRRLQTSCRDADTGEVTVGFGHGSGDGAVGFGPETVSKYPHGAHPDSAAHGSQPGCGVGRQCH